MLIHEIRKALDAFRSSQRTIAPSAEAWERSALRRIGQLKALLPSWEGIAPALALDCESDDGAIAVGYLYPNASVALQYVCRPSEEDGRTVISIKASGPALARTSCLFVQGLLIEALRAEGPWPELDPNQGVEIEIKESPRPEAMTKELYKQAVHALVASAEGEERETAEAMLPDALRLIDEGADFNTAWEQAALLWMKKTCVENGHPIDGIEETHAALMRAAGVKARPAHEEAILKRLRDEASHLIEGTIHGSSARAYTKYVLGAFFVQTLAKANSLGILPSEMIAAIMEADRDINGRLTDAHKFYEEFTETKKPDAKAAEANFKNQLQELLTNRIKDSNGAPMHVHVLSIDELDAFIEGKKKERAEAQSEERNEENSDKEPEEAVNMQTDAATAAEVDNTGLDMSDLDPPFSHEELNQPATFDLVEREDTAIDSSESTSASSSYSDSYSDKSSYDSGSSDCGSSSCD